MTIPNGEKTIYLHIGMPKTGTSSIQYFLFQNREKLEKHGVSYPMPDLGQSSTKASEHDGAINLRYLFENNIRNRRDQKKAFETALLDKIQSTHCEKIILSDEMLAAVNYSTICFFLEVLANYGFSLKVIVYIRPVADWFASRWYERMRPYSIHSRMSMLEFCFDTNTFTCEHVLPLIKKLGKENVIIRPYEKQQWKNQNLIEDFLSIFNINLSTSFSLPLKKGRLANGRNTAELSRMISYLRLNCKMDFNNKILQLNVKEAKAVETLTDAEILALTEKYSEMYKKIARIYNKESLFINELPSCFGKDRPVYKNITFNHEQYTILLDALKYNSHEKSEICKEIEKFTHNPYQVQHHVVLHDIFNWDDIYNPQTDSVSFTFEQHQTFLKVLEANRIERALLWGKLNSLKLSFKEKMYSIWFEDDRIVLHLFGLRIKPSKAICSFEQERCYVVIKLLGCKIKCTNWILW